MKESSKKVIDQQLQEFIHYSELKQLTYNLISLQQEKKFHSLTVLSFFPAEGKTLFCAALAMAYVDSCRAKVLVVDTATFENKGSLALRHLFNGSAPQVDVRSLEELRANSLDPSPSTPRRPEPKTPAVEPEILHDRHVPVSVKKESDFSLIKKAAEDPSREYGLVLLDTAPMQARNRRNIDPLLVARLSDASVLVASRTFLDAPKLSASLKILQDPALHLIGIISNERKNA